MSILREEEEDDDKINQLIKLKTRQATKNIVCQGPKVNKEPKARFVPHL